MPGTQTDEGCWFAVPLRDGGFATGVVARANPKGVLFGYFFGPRRPTVPTLADVAAIRADDAIWIGRFGDLGLREGDWPFVGRDATWKRAEWPMPPFHRYEELTGRSFRVVYDDVDPHQLVHEELAELVKVEALPRDGLAGAGFVEIRLTRLLGAVAG